MSVKSSIKTDVAFLAELLRFKLRLIWQVVPFSMLRIASQHEGPILLNTPDASVKEYNSKHVEETKPSPAAPSSARTKSSSLVRQEATFTALEAPKTYHYYELHHSYDYSFYDCY